MTPSQTIIQQANSQTQIVDPSGRRLVLRRPIALDTLRLLKAAGPNLAQNEPWLGMAGLVFCIVEIDGVPVPNPVTEQQIEALVERLGEEGLSAIANWIDSGLRPDLPGTLAGNSVGTLS